MEGYSRHIKWKPVEANYKILQIYSKGLEYSLVSSNYEQCHPFVWCKDFLQDVIYSATNKKNISIYKFKFNPFTDPLPCLDRTRLLITNPKDKSFSKKITKVVDFINQIENQLKIKKSFVRRCASPPDCYKKSGIFMFEGSKRWIQAPPMLSLYSLFLRTGFCHTEGKHFTETIQGIVSGEIKPYQRKDAFFLQKIDPAFQKILRVGDRRIFCRDIQLNYPSSMNVDTIHNCLGAIGFAKDLTYKSLGQNVLVPYWHYQK